VWCANDGRKYFLSELERESEESGRHSAALFKDPNYIGDIILCVIQVHNRVGRRGPLLQTYIQGAVRSPELTRGTLEVLRI
jgi:hypothetical protein